MAKRKQPEPIEANLSYQQMEAAIPKIDRRIADLENFEDVGRVGLIMEGTGIDHAHIKLVPMHGTENLKKGVWKQVLSGKEFWFEKYEGWISSGSGPMADSEDLKKLASKIRQSYGNN